jgi:membrane fusion protein (multidrug efflux system)
MADETASPSHSETGASASSGSTPEKRYSPDARRKRRRNVIIIIAVAVAIAAGLLLWRYLSSYESTDDAQVDVHLYPVSARISGYVVKVNVGDNQWV